MPLQLDATGLPLVQGLTREDIQHGFRLFFLNQPKAAEEFFDKYKDSVVLFAVGKSAILWLWALLSLEPADIEAAVSQLSETQANASALLKQLKPRSWFRSSQSTNESLHCEVIIAQCIILTATLQFISGSLLDKIKGGINFRMVVSKYAQLEKETTSRSSRSSVSSIDESMGDVSSDDVPVDDWVLPQTQSMIHFGVGVFNLVTSILPPRLRKVASVFGFPCNRAKGLRLLRESFLADSIISPISGLVLLVHHCIIQMCFDETNHKYKRDAHEILHIASQRYPDSGLFHMMRGRYFKLSRELSSAISCFSRSMEVQKEWKPLVDMGYYENGFLYLFLGEMDKALDHFKQLLETNDWSKVFYAYMCGICAFCLNKKYDAIKYFKSIRESKVRQLHGQQLTVDRFATRKVKQYIVENDILLYLPHIEIMYVWGGLYQLPERHLGRICDEIITTPYTGTEQTAVRCLLLGAVYTQLHELQKAEALLNEVEKMKNNIQQETWVIPYARFEIARVWRLIDGTGTSRVMSKLQKSFYKTEHNFDVRLHFRVHLTQYHLKHAEELELDNITTKARALSITGELPVMDTDVNVEGSAQVLIERPEVIVVPENSDSFCLSSSGRCRDNLSQESIVFASDKEEEGNRRSASSESLDSTQVETALRKPSSELQRTFV